MDPLALGLLVALMTVFVLFSGVLVALGLLIAIILLCLFPGIAIWLPNVVMGHGQ